MKITVAELIESLKVYPGGAQVIFGGHPGLDFYRVDKRGEDLVQIEFNQTVGQDSDGKWFIQDTSD
jgi:hypothetical protein